MFKRLQFEEWTLVAPVAAFFLTLAVFIYFVVRAVRLRRNHVKRMSELPLDDDASHPPRS